VPLDLRAYRRGAVVISDVPPKIFIQENIIAKTLGFSSRRPRAGRPGLGLTMMPRSTAKAAGR
jgi:hypothetical protein